MPSPGLGYSNNRVHTIAPLLSPLQWLLWLLACLTMAQVKCWDTFMTGSHEMNDSATSLVPYS